MSLALATKGILGGYMAASAEPYPVGVENVESLGADTGNLYMDVITDDYPVTPSPDGSEIRPSTIKRRSMEGVKPRFTTFPGPNNL